MGDEGQYVWKLHKMWAMGDNMYGSYIRCGRLGTICMGVTQDVGDGGQYVWELHKMWATGDNMYGSYISINHCFSSIYNNQIVICTA